jgi:hypothetical protein
VCGEELNDKNERKGEDASRERGRRRLMVSSGYNRQIYIYRYEQGKLKMQSKRLSIAGIK